MRNGIEYECSVSENWGKIENNYLEMSKKIEETYALMKIMTQHIQHLSKLDALEDIRDSLLESATGRNHIDANMAMLVFKVLGAVIVVLLFVLLFLLTGQHFNFVTLFKGA